MDEWVVLLHVTAVFWFVAGLLGRDVTMARALGQPLAGSDDWWLLFSLLLFLAIGVLVPTVFLPHGKVFEHALAEAKARRGDARTPHRASRPRRT
jgi:hypothetical protein